LYALRSVRSQAGAFPIASTKPNWKPTASFASARMPGRIEHWKSTINVNVSFAGDQITASMNQYTATDVASLKAKLAQYPSGTKLWLNVFGSPEHVASAHAAIADIAAEHGFELAQSEPVK